MSPLRRLLLADDAFKSIATTAKGDNRWPKTTSQDATARRGDIINNKNQRTQTAALIRSSRLLDYPID